MGKAVTKDLKFTVSFIGCNEEVTRAALKKALEECARPLAKSHCKCVRVSRFDPGNEVRRARALKKLAEEAITNVVNNSDKSGGGGTDG
jgi:2'-5' RNA ligase